MLKLLERLRGGRGSAQVGRNAVEQLRFQLYRDLRAMMRLEETYPDRLAPGLFFAWQRHRHLRQACEGYAAELTWLTGSSVEVVLTDALNDRLDTWQAHSDDTRKETATTRYHQWFSEQDECRPPVDVML